ncbi:MAG TPA: ABC transporter permease [Sulfolobales archaeon]|nr:ABC transporter permease [Sulfolobales archaeon]
MDDEKEKLRGVLLGLAYFIFKRFSYMALTFFIVIVINFLIINLAPGDPIRFIAGELTYASPDFVNYLRAKWGLDRPLYERLFSYILNIAHGDLGYSYRYLQPVSTLILERLPLTFLLTLTSNLAAFIIGLILGIFSAMRFGSRFDFFLSFSNTILWSTPSFVLGIILMFVLGVRAKLFPVSGLMDLRNPKEGVFLYLDIIYHSFLPILTLTLVLLPLYYKVVRDSVIQQSTEEYIMALRAVGFSDTQIYWKHVLRNAILPPLTVFMLHLGYSIAGAVFVEIIFGWPGMGRLLLDSILTRDYPTIMGIYVVISLTIIVVNFVTDLLYSIFDPRVKLR